MITAILTIISALLGIVGGLMEKHYSPEAVKKREGIERDKEIAKQDYHAVSKRLSDRLDAARMRNKNRSNTR